MIQRYQRFIRGVAINKFGMYGVALTTSSFIAFILFELLWISGIVNNSYFGLISYLALPSLFIIGLILIPIGWLYQRQKTGKTVGGLISESFLKDDMEVSPGGSRVWRITWILTAINLLFIVIVSVRTLGFMDESEFCGTACHTVMNPEWVTYQNSPHARVRCVECHVGEGVGALISSKLNGVRQMVLATFNQYNRPIPTPVHQLRPSRETCEKCHWPEKFYGVRIKNSVSYKADELSTPIYTTLALKIDAGQGEEKAGIHWHIGAENDVRYTSADDRRREMLLVEYRQKDGTYKQYFNQAMKDSGLPSSDKRTMDCVDCHNRATHIYENPEKALDKRLTGGHISLSLPFIKREAMNAISSFYQDNNRADAGIENHLFRFYQENYPELAARNSQLIAKAVDELKQIYHRNIHPEMKIDWGSYPSHLGHQMNLGCFRCHNENLAAADGSKISFSCTMCHSILANEENEAFKYLKEADENDLNRKMHRYLQDEFLESSK